MTIAARPIALASRSLTGAAGAANRSSLPVSPIEGQLAGGDNTPRPSSLPASFYDRDLSHGLASHRGWIALQIALAATGKYECYPVEVQT